jgi:dihydrofolate reductase
VGRDNRLLFRLKADMANFRKITAKTPLVMGRKTWESFPKRPLPGRPNIVATRNLAFEAPGAFVFSSLPPALAAARAMAAKASVPEVAVIGGPVLWADAFEHATHMSLTEVDAEADADVWFPKFDRSEWREVSAVKFAKDADNEAAFVIRELERIR